VCEHATGALVHELVLGAKGTTRRASVTCARWGTRRSSSTSRVSLRRTNIAHGRSASHSAPCITDTLAAPSTERTVQPTIPCPALRCIAHMAAVSQPWSVVPRGPMAVRNVWFGARPAAICRAALCRTHCRERCTEGVSVQCVRQWAIEADAHSLLALYCTALQTTTKRKSQN
jgi:hypothetical protein